MLSEKHIYVGFTDHLYCFELGIGTSMRIDWLAASDGVFAGHGMAWFVLDGA